MTQQPATLLEVSNLGKVVYNGKTALRILHDVHLHVEHGESVAIVGVSGSGKSTLLALIAGLDTPTSGSVRLDGEVLGELDEDGRARLRARLVGFVFQSFQLLPNLTALENVMLPLELAGLGSAACKERAMQWLYKVGLLARTSHYPKQLSGGEQQRVALARAFAPCPALLLADEPTGNLDDATGGEVINLIFELNLEQETTLILVTHDAHIAARSSRIYRMRDGTIDTAPPQEAPW